MAATLIFVHSPLLGDTPEVCKFVRVPLLVCAWSHCVLNEATNRIEQTFVTLSELQQGLAGDLPPAKNGFILFLF